MIAALQQLADRSVNENMKNSRNMTANYLEACNQFFKLVYSQISILVREISVCWTILFFLIRISLRIGSPNFYLDLRDTKQVPARRNLF